MKIGMKLIPKYFDYFAMKLNEVYELLIILFLDDFCTHWIHEFSNFCNAISLSSKYESLKLWMCEVSSTLTKVLVKIN